MSEILQEVARRPDGLVLPKVVADLTLEQLSDISNGCGPASMKVKLIPDSILGVNFFPACCGHDGSYSYGQDEWDKEEADILFLGNLLRAVNAKYPGDTIEERLLRKGARHLAFVYFEAVADLGKTAFFAGKDK